MLLHLREISLKFTEQPVLNDVSLGIDEGERICLVGRNGAGKSTLLKVIAGLQIADEGEIEHADTLRVSQLPQDVPRDISGTVYEVVTHGLGAIGGKLLAYEQAEHQHVSEEQLHRLQHDIEEAGAWDLKVRVDSIISRMQLDEEAEFSKLSGGLKRRVLLAKALVNDPDILLLDEPTNHLDIEGVMWLENFLLNAPFALVFISHDRAFVDRIATRIVEVDRGKLYSWPGRYSEYRRRKAEALEIERRTNREFDKKLAEEEQWIRRGVKARTKRNMGRVRALEEMREAADSRIKYQRRAQIKAQFGEQSSKRVLEAKKLYASINDQTILQDFNLRIKRGMVIGVMGPNGCGKTTLLRLLLGQHAPDKGKLIHGENLEIAYFDQTRSQLNLDKTAAWNVNDGSDRIRFDGKDLHVLGYLKAFLFDPDRARSPVQVLSGGERNRLLLARLFAQPSNVLVLDEPTNDLDVETLELLEDLVHNYPGTIILVSHDRAFVNHVVDGMLVHEGEKGFAWYVGNYDDWQRQKKDKTTGNRKSAPAAEKVSSAMVKSPAPGKPVKLTYRDQRELDGLPARIEELEQQLKPLHAQLADPEFYKQGEDVIRDLQIAIRDIETDLARAYARWEELET